MRLEYMKIIFYDNKKFISVKFNSDREGVSVDFAYLKGISSISLSPPHSNTLY